MEDIDVLANNIAIGQQNFSAHFLSKDKLGHTGYDSTVKIYDLNKKSYIPFSGCVVQHIITADNLSNLEKLYYIHAYGLASINANSGKDRSVSLPAEKWANYLRCSRSQIFVLQKSLVCKGYFLIRNTKNPFGQNNRNIITPSIPDSVFGLLLRHPNKTGCSEVYNPVQESKLTYLARTKLFIRMNYQLLRSLASTENLNPLQKIIWLDLYCALYKSSFSVENTEHSLTLAYSELANRYSISAKSVTKHINILEKAGFITKEKIFMKNFRENEDYTLRKDRLLWKINLLLDRQILSFTDFPEQNSSIKKSFLQKSGAENKCFVPLNSDPQISEFGLLLNKDLKLKNNIIRSMKSNFFEKSFEGNPLGNTENHFTSEIEVDLTNKSASSSKIKTLKDFYPLSLEDCNLLQSKSGREFSLLAMNEILKDMSNKLKDRAFKSKKAFMAYMSKAFSYELRDAVKINNENFRIRNNQSEEERGSNQIEEYLSKIEYSLQVSPEMHFKKKLCATLESRTAYELLRSYNSSRIDGDILKIFVNKDVSLSNSEKEIIKNQAKASHESLDLATGNMITISDIEIIVSQQTYQNQNHKIQSHQVCGDQGNSSLTSDIEIKDDVWSRVRRELAGIYGEGVDQNWFAKLNPEINETQKEIKLTAPSDFFKDWIDRNYKNTIENLLKIEEYNCLIC